MCNKHVGPQVLALILIAALFAGCAAPTAAPAPTQAPTAAATVDLQPTLNALGTVAAKTVVAELTRSAPTASPVPPTGTPAPSATPAPTNTPLPPTASPTATYIPWTATPAGTATLTTFNCTITSASPKAADTVKAGGNFDGQWVVKNSGTETWLAAETDIRYLSGTKMQKLGDFFDLPGNVASGASFTVTIDMVAPADAGTYKAAWAIITGNTTVCALNLSVVVVK